jgi:MOSC domain-containing protein YiiM
VVCRQADEQRTTPGQVRLCPEQGVIGDRWIHGSADPQMQVALMRVDVAHLIAGGQHPAMFGDNILVDLDLSVDQIPPGTRLRVGSAVCLVSEEPHNPCSQFASRFGMAAFRLVADKRWRAERLRGVYLQVVERGVVAPGDGIEVLKRR